MCIRYLCHPWLWEWELNEKESKWDGIEIGCDLELDSISVFITENEWAMHKYDLEMGVDCVARPRMLHMITLLMLTKT